MKEERLRELLACGLAGDAAKYRRFLDEISAHLRAYLRRRLASLPDEVEDLLQELLLAIHNQRHTYDPNQPLMPWVRAIARYKLVDLHRRRSRNEALQDPLDDYQDLFASTNREESEARFDIEKLLALLPDRQRFPILCVKIEGNVGERRGATHGHV